MRYRILYNGSKYCIQRCCEHRFLWWKWETWNTWSSFWQHWGLMYVLCPEINCYSFFETPEKAQAELKALKEIAERECAERRHGWQAIEHVDG